MILEPNNEDKESTSVSFLETPHARCMVHKAVILFERDILKG